MKKSFFAAIVLLATPILSHAQSDDRRELDLSIGFSTPTLQAGKELIRSKDLREAGRSYYADDQGNRKAVGEYGSQVGWFIGLGYIKYLKSYPQLGFGGSVRSSLTGSTPSDGYAEGYYFNHLSASAAVKYRPT